MTFEHKPVLLAETLDLLNIKANGRYVDGTLGLGGHAEGILKRLAPEGRLVGLDADPLSIEKAKARLEQFGEKVLTRHVNFRGLEAVLGALGWDGVDGMLFDLGVSSLHFDDGTRGFSIQNAGPLDMRMDPTHGDTAVDKLRRLSESSLVDLLKQFGETQRVERLSREILRAVAEGRLNTTADLAQLCEIVLPRRGRVHPGTRVFLALRVLVNDELGALRDLLQKAPLLLKPGGRLAIISFHSLEDRLVKDSFRSLARADTAHPSFRLITKKPVSPTFEEANANPRSRSAKLRVLERSS